MSINIEMNKNVRWVNIVSRLLREYSYEKIHTRIKMTLAHWMETLKSWSKYDGIYRLLRNLVYKGFSGSSRSDNRFWKKQNGGKLVKSPIYVLGTFMDFLSR